MNRIRAVAVRQCIAGGVVVTASLLYYLHNESEVVRVADRLDRITQSYSQPHSLSHSVTRTDVTDTATLRELSHPMVVSGMTKSWKANKTWSFDSLRSSIGQAPMDCGSVSSDLTLPFYLVAYNATERSRGRHDLGLYVFDSNFSESSGKASLLNDFSSLPQLTSGDIFARGSAGEHSDRPTHRWLLAGPPGSGTCLHQDPWQYSSWNASIVGRKKWVLFPPSTPFELLHPPREDDTYSTTDNITHDLIRWFTNGCYRVLASVFGMREIPRSACEFMNEVLPTIRNKGLGEVEFIQHPGEVVAFPAGWWHAVVNLDATIAVTESFGMERDSDRIIAALQKGGNTEYAEVISQQLVKEGKPMTDNTADKLT